MKRSISIFICAMLLIFAAGCSSAPASSEPASSEPALVEGQKPALLVVSFGTSYNETREKTIGAIEEKMRTSYPDLDVRRAFTSQIIIDKLKSRDNLEIDNVEAAMQRLADDGVTQLAVQPTHVMSGEEYDEMNEMIAPFADKFDKLSIGLPLLSSDDDYKAVTDIITTETAEYYDEDTAIIFMGHGTEHEANATYAKLQTFLSDGGFDRYFIGTVEAAPSLDDVMELVNAANVKKVVLLPLMIVAGDHATNDMAGDEEDSWKTAFKSEGYEVECMLKGLGEYEGIQEMFVEHAADAVKDIV